MQMRSLRRPSTTAARGGFSLVELVITMTIMTILVGVVSMRANGMTDKARATKIIATIEGLRTPVLLYNQDTNQFPLEHSQLQGATYHRLSTDPGISGWDGPYIDDPISRAWNPSGSSVVIYNSVISSYTNGNGFDLDGDGTADVTGANGCMFSLWAIEEGVAEKVDRAFDNSLPGTWSDAGRVEYNATTRQLAFLLGNR